MQYRDPLEEDDKPRETTHLLVMGLDEQACLVYPDGDGSLLLSRSPHASVMTGGWVFLSGTRASDGFTSITAARNEDGVGVVASWARSSSGWCLAAWGSTENYQGHAHDSPDDPLPDAPPIAGGLLSSENPNAIAVRSENVTDEHVEKLRAVLDEQPPGTWGSIVLLGEASETKSLSPGST